MRLDEFTTSLAGDGPPPGCIAPLQALWWLRRDGWEQAHALVQDDPGVDAAWVHAHLHRCEGDHGNAAYWYRRARRPAADGPLEAEWASMVAALLADG